MAMIYKITNPKGCIYIGQTSNFEKRLNDYKYISRCRQRRLYNSIKKYGFYSHLMEIVEDAPLEQLDERERFWINYYQSNYTKNRESNGLNLTDGGNFINKRGKKLTEEHKNKIRSSHLGKKISEQGRIKCGQSMKGKCHSPEVIEKIRLSSKGRYLSKQSREKLSKSRMGIRCASKWKGVHMIDKRTDEIIKTFDCMLDASKYLGKNRGQPNISLVCNGKLNSALGYKWQWVKRNEYA